MNDDALGFVGVGHMGAPMAARLLNAGRSVVVFDTNETAMDALASVGAQRAASAREVADAAQTVFFSLPYPEAVQQAASGPAGVIEGEAVRRVVDFSTIGPRMARTVAERFASRSIAYVDAPVSGGVGGARAGTLAIMVSSPKPLFDELQSTFAIFGKAFHVGDCAGQAQTMKLANNLLAAAAIAISSEAMVMGMKAGLDPR